MFFFVQLISFKINLKGSDLLVIKKKTQFSTAK
jgi:hypothetical protein